MEKARPDAIFCIAKSRPAYHFIYNVVNKNPQTSFLCIDRLFSIQKELERSRGIKIILASVVPDPQKSNIPIVVQYRKDMKTYFPKYKNLSPFSLEGYINAVLLSESIKIAQFPVSENA